MFHEDGHYSEKTETRHTFKKWKIHFYEDSILIALEFLRKFQIKSANCDKNYIKT